MPRKQFIPKAAPTNMSLKSMFLVLDFEANCSQAESFDHEIIEFPCVLVSASGEIIDEFRQFVKLVNHSKISDFIQDLTGITDNDLATGCSWSECLERFETWALLNNVNSENTTVVTCGDWDLKTMLPRQLATTQDCLTEYSNSLFSCWNNVKLTFARNPITRNFNRRERLPAMDVMLQELGMVLKGRHHSGMDDCKNIVRICIWLNKNGSDLTTPNKIRTEPFWNNQKLYYKRSCTGGIITIED